METLAWGSLEPIIGTRAPHLLSMGGTKGVQIGWEPDAKRLLLRVPLQDVGALPTNNLAELAIQQRAVGAGSVLEISTGSEHLFREFHRFASLITEDFEQPGRSAKSAFDAAADRWRELTAPKLLLSGEQQLGLYGELVVLNALIERLGPQAIGAWTGRTEDWPERHDFRFGALDVEVKATRNSERSHVIHGLRQLEPGEGRKLYLLSLQFEIGGFEQGCDLGTRVDRIRDAVVSSPTAKERFEKGIAAAMFRDGDRQNYASRYVLASEPRVIAVDEGCPRLTTIGVAALLGPLASRVGRDVSYRINVDGLGEGMGSPAYASIFGAEELS